jgi:hypothetical protein
MPAVRRRTRSHTAERQVSVMTDPLDKATSRAPATIGEGCLSRYDPDELTPADGTDFEGAAQLWQELHPADEAGSAPESEKDA